VHHPELGGTILYKEPEYDPPAILYVEPENKFENSILGNSGENADSENMTYLMEEPEPDEVPSKTNLCSDPEELEVRKNAKCPDFNPDTYQGDVIGNNAKIIQKTNDLFTKFEKEITAMKEAYKKKHEEEKKEAEKKKAEKKKEENKTVTGAMKSKLKKAFSFKKYSNSHANRL
jgi:hypothetical protein